MLMMMTKMMMMTMMIMMMMITMMMTMMMTMITIMITMIMMIMICCFYFLLQLVGEAKCNLSERPKPHPKRTVRCYIQS